jgi:hypothetical protein
MSVQTESQRSRFPVVIDGVERSTTDPVITGRQLLDLAGRVPAEEHIVYFLTPERILEDLSLEETVDLREPGKESFLTFRSDRSFRFQLNGKREDWGAPQITEPTLKKLAGVNGEHEVWLERQAEPDLALEPGQTVQLDAPGIERFRTELARALVHVVDLNTNREVSFRAPWTATLAQVWDKAYAELKETRRDRDTLECEHNGQSLMERLNLTLEQVRAQGICPDLHLQIRGGTGGA